MWRDVVMRSAGFPADLVLALSDPKLAGAADAADGDPDRLADYRREYGDATERLSAAIREVARLPRFREAVAWQNPKLIKQCLDKLAAGEPRNVRGRNHELAVAGYLQRYCLKNDTIGFFGPVGWARWTDGGEWLTTYVGDRRLSRRTVQLETWAVDAVGRALFADPAVRPWLAPRRHSSHLLDGATLYLADRSPVPLNTRDRRLLAVADGQHSLRDIAAELVWSEFPDLGDENALLAAYEGLAERGLVQLGYPASIRTAPERTLVDEVRRISDPAVREPAMAVVRDFIDARDRVAAAAGDDAAVEAALADLAKRFVDITGLDGERRAGQTYAGRTLVYEDTVLGTRVDLEAKLREELSGPLRLLLAAARWLVAEVADEYERIFQELYERRAGQSGSPDVPLAAILSLATPYLFFDLRQLRTPVRRVVAEFQRRWQTILGLPVEGRLVQVRSEEIAAEVERLFPSRRLPWATGIHHSPDLMIAAPDAAAVARGDFFFVLGELHVALNTVESRVFVQGHDDPASLLANAEADLGGRRIYGIPALTSSAVSSRVAPPSALLSPGYAYWAQHPESVTPPAPIIPAADLVVRREAGRLMVYALGGDFSATLAETLGEFLAGVVVNGFKPVPGPHTPRVVIDRLVLARESWTFRAGDVPWARVASEPERFLQARKWRERNGLPERVFVKVPVEDKPTFADFGSLVYVNVLAKLIRRSAEADGTVSLTEMVPDASQLWLRDAEGRGYTSELRIVAVCPDPE